MLQVAAILAIGMQRRHALHQLRGRLGLREEKREIGAAEKLAMALRQAADMGVVEALISVFAPLVPEIVVSRARDGSTFVVDSPGTQAPTHSPYEGWFSWAAFQLNAVRFQEGVHIAGSDRISWMTATAGRAVLRGETVPSAAADMAESFPALLEMVETTGSDPRTTGESWQEVARRVTAYRGREWIDLVAYGPVPPAVAVAIWPDGARIDRLISTSQFADEGNSMQHCVGGDGYQDLEADGNSQHWSESREGNVAFFSYRDPSGVPKATLMVRLHPVPGIIPNVPYAEQLQGWDDEDIRDGAAKRRVRGFIRDVLTIDEDQQVHKRCEPRTVDPLAGRPDVPILLFSSVKGPLLDSVRFVQLFRRTWNDMNSTLRFRLPDPSNPARVEAGSPNGAIVLRIDLTEVASGGPAAVDPSGTLYGKDARLLKAAVDELCGRFERLRVDISSEPARVVALWRKLAEIVKGIEVVG